MRRLLLRKRIIIPAALFALFIVWLEWGPYSVRHFFQIKAVTLVNDVKRWKTSERPINYGRTNGADRCFLTNMRFSDGTNDLLGVMVLESTAFHGRGILIATEDERIYRKKGVRVWRIR